MDADRFDTLTRLIGSRTSRRVIVGLAATGLLSVVVPEAAATRCSKQHPCPACKRCKRRKCKPDATQDGTPCAADKTCQSGDCRCAGLTADCEGTGTCSTDLTTPEHCGACDNACPGFEQPGGDAVCADPSSGRCTLICHGERYDVDGDPANGCEKTDTGVHVRSAAEVVTSTNCGGSSIVRGTVLSDSRTHPNVGAFDSAVGAAPDYWQIRAFGGACLNDLDITFTTTDGGSTPCYRLTVTTDIATFQSAVISGNESYEFVTDTGSYSSNTLILYKVEKTCNLPVQEAVAYAVQTNF